jgi:hypothetical protein
MGKVVSKIRSAKKSALGGDYKNEEDEEAIKEYAKALRAARKEETSDSEEECCGEEKASKDTFKGMKKGLKPPSLEGLEIGGLGGGSASPAPCLCRDLFVMPLPDPTQVKDLLAKGRVGGDEGETKGEDQV